MKLPVELPVEPVALLVEVVDGPLAPEPPLPSSNESTPGLHAARAAPRREVASVRRGSDPRRRYGLRSTLARIAASLK
jgi:hypothetical protein